MTGSPLNPNHGDHSRGNGWAKVVLEVMDTSFELIGLVFEFLGALF